MKIEIENTSKIVTLNGVPARIWEGKTNTGIKVHCYITRIVINNDEPAENIELFQNELSEQKAPSNEIEAIPLSLIL